MLFYEGWLFFLGSFWVAERRLNIGLGNWVLGLMGSHGLVDGVTHEGYLLELLKFIHNLL